VAVLSTTIIETRVVRIATTTILIIVTTTSVFAFAFLTSLLFARNTIRLWLACRGFFDGAGKTLAYSVKRAKYKNAP
jgi:hypothetical protein